MTPAGLTLDGLLAPSSLQEAAAPRRVVLSSPNAKATARAARCMPESIRQDARCGRIDLGGQRLI